MKTFKQLREDALEAAAKKLMSGTTSGPTSSDGTLNNTATRNLSRNTVTDFTSASLRSNPNNPEPRTIPNLARPRSLDAVPNRQTNLATSSFNANYGNKLVDKLGPGARMSSSTRYFPTK